jgi:prophage antirepressor-like protein
MSSSFHCYNFDEYQFIRLKIIENMPWFSVADVCNMLKITRKDSVDYLKSNQMILCDNFLLVSESGFHKLILKSKFGEPVLDWFSDKVMPDIRKNLIKADVDKALEWEKEQYKIDLILRIIEKSEMFENDLLALAKETLRNILKN